MTTASLTDRGLLRAVVVGFALLVVWHFATAVATVALLLATALLLAVALSAPVEALHRHKVPRPAAVAAIVVALLAVLGIVGYLLLPTLAQELALLASSLPDALQQLVERLRDLANRLGVKIGGGGGGFRPKPWRAPRAGSSAASSASSAAWPPSLPPCWCSSSCPCT